MLITTAETARYVGTSLSGAILPAKSRSFDLTGKSLSAGVERISRFTCGKWYRILSDLPRDCGWILVELSCYFFE
jgi:hypothetical protein